MMNVFLLVGKVKEVPVVSTTAKGNNIAHMIVEADRNFRNEDGSLSSDLFKVTLWKGIADECAAICGEGSLVAIRGRLKSDVYTRNDREYYNNEIIAEQVKFLDGRRNRTEG
ncbi:MAG: single-stranded DNA-binding protein [Solobacterium sp.]|nr:single-stranded DNA-binding protein [Solobacterium sp.]